MGVNPDRKSSCHNLGGSLAFGAGTVWCSGSRPVWLGGGSDIVLEDNGKAQRPSAGTAETQSP